MIRKLSTRIHLVSTATAFLAVAPAMASLRITGIIEGNPTEANSPAEALTLYKSLEFFADSPISSTEMMKYALRRFENASPGSATTFQLNPTGNPAISMFDNEYGFAVVDTDAFKDLYSAGGLGGENWAANSGQFFSPYPRILLQDVAIASSGGNEVYQLLYYPGGFGTTPGHTFQVVDTLGIAGDSSASSWSYQLSYAYRRNGMAATGSSFNPAEWEFGGPGLFADDPGNPNDGTDFEGHSSVVPFGTFTTVPEPGSLSLLVIGLAWFRRLRLRR